MRKFYVWKVKNDIVEIKGSDAFHIKRVLRKKVGDYLFVVDETQTTYRVKITSLRGDEVRGEIVEVLRESTELPLTLSLYQAVPRLPVMDEVVEIATEEGCVRIVPVFTERASVNRVSRERVERWRRIAREVSKQVGRDKIPEIAEPVSIDKLDEVLEEELKVALWEGVDSPLLVDVVEKVEPELSVALFIGPEGGLSQKDVESLLSLGFELSSLGKRILKVRTAVAVALGAFLLKSFTFGF